MSKFFCDLLQFLKEKNFKYFMKTKQSYISLADNALNNFEKSA